VRAAPTLLFIVGPRLNFTYVCAFDMPGDLAELASYAAAFQRRSRRILYRAITQFDLARLAES
jgi:hypothetical protein